MRGKIAVYERGALAVYIDVSLGIDGYSPCSIGRL
jgi:hypothetical protein